VENGISTLHPFDRSAEGGREMIRAHSGTIAIVSVVLGTSMLCAADFSTYRGMHFGMNLTAAAKQTGTKLTEVRVVHQRPALIQEVDWQPRPVTPSGPLAADPVKEGLLCFYNGELFRVVVTYDRYKVEGMTAEDMIDGISATYGTATRPTAEIAYHSNYGEVGEVVARWENSEYSYDLVRTGDRSSFAMVLYSKRLEALAQAANVEAVKLEAEEAPKRELEKQRKKDDAEHLVLEQARSVNKPNFRP
jgi:hypothetical protein